MLKRDLPNDYCQKYFPQISKERFYEQATDEKYKKNQEIYLLNSQAQQLNKISKNLVNYIQLSLGLSLLGVIFFKYIPFVNKIQSKAFKVFGRIGLLILPTYQILQIQTQNIRKIKQQIYNAQHEKYKKYLLSGQLRLLSQNIELYDQVK